MTEIDRLVVIGASAGGVEALRTLVSGIAPDIPAPILVVLHLPTGGRSVLPSILERAGRLPAVSVRHEMPLANGQIYVAPPGHHLLVAGDRAALSHGPTESGHRPAIDALFRSAARSTLPTVGVLLSGVLDDGVAGLASIVAHGGVAVAQDPTEALFPDMPAAVLREIPDAVCMPSLKIGETLTEWLAALSEAHAAAAGSDDVMLMEDDIARGAGDRHGHLGRLAGISCPDCHGPLSEIDPGSRRYRCRVGHAWTAAALLDAQAVELERALWTALRTLEERASLAGRLQSEARRRGSDTLVRRYGDMFEECGDAARVIRQHLLAADQQSPADP
ncbi:chemotaxis protein CheB [Fodinicola acaciae]|uniref:chemotaxis protein CheB n=1 Tax=Fodinicola acaciae TaxID=2681555 RepID=UPI0013D4618D|nr:chemotaxis protein CheB [Fodinicola acaciae]